MRKLIASFVVALFAFVAVHAQTIIKGTVIDQQYSNPLVGATVAIKGTQQGTLTDMNGDFVLKVTSPKVTLEISYVGYAKKDIEVQTKGKKIIDLGQIGLKPVSQEINEIYVVAERASEQKTPVAISNIERKKIQFLLGSQDLPMVMNVTPSVYATEQGGGSGDARINVRGFDQRNVAIMINGVPVNDMENGWVYWSNWDGIADVTSSIQLQRGLSAVNLAVPSIGGTINIVTSPASKERGGVIRTEVTSFYDNIVNKFKFAMFKTAITYNTGMINKKFAFNVSLVRKFGPGIIDKTWADAWAYYFGMTYKINDKNKIELFALGAPQRHGQNLYMQNLAAYDADYFLKLGGDPAALKKFPQDERGRFYNQNWSPVNPEYNGLQWWNGRTHVRHSPYYINERENYYHKPLVNLNIYNHFSDKVSLFTVLYYSGGNGGGAGTYGHMAWDYDSHPSRVVDYNRQIYVLNANGRSVGILRNSVNQQYEIGGVTKLRILFNDNLKANFGLDIRTSRIFHFREVRDLLGGDYYIDHNNYFAKTDTCRLGDKINYYFKNHVNWLGYYGQVEYSNTRMTAYLTLGNSFVQYSHYNYFKHAPNDTTKHLFLKSKFLPGYQVKTGISFLPIEGLKTYVNFGYISKAPKFDDVINDRAAIMAKNPQNEKFESAEIGAIYKYKNLADIRVNFYYTYWKDRAISRLTYDQATDAEQISFITGLNELHEGFEFETYFRPLEQLNFALAGSFGNWYYTNDVQSTLTTLSRTGQVTVDTLHLYIKGVKVGDAPQKQIMATITYKPFLGARISLVGRYYADYYARFDPTTRTSKEDAGKQVWKVPNYYIFDLHMSYHFKNHHNQTWTIYAHVYNLLNALYVSDAVDDSRYTALNIYDPKYMHTVNDAGVFVGLPRNWTVGLRFAF